MREKVKEREGEAKKEKIIDKLSRKNVFLFCCNVMDIYYIVSSRHIDIATIYTGDDDDDEYIGVLYCIISFNTHICICKLRRNDIIEYRCHFNGELQYGFV